MPKNISAELKLQAVKEYLDGKVSSYLIAEKYGVNRASFCAWVRKYRALGNTAFIRSGHYNSYTTQFKIKVITEYLSGNENPQSICIKYKIPSISTLKEWIMKYNGHEKLKTSGIGGSTIMTKGRITSFDERVAIVQYCITHNHNYPAMSILCTTTFKHFI